MEVLPTSRNWDRHAEGELFHTCKFLNEKYIERELFLHFTELLSFAFVGIVHLVLVLNSAHKEQVFRSLSWVEKDLT